MAELDEESGGEKFYQYSHLNYRLIIGGLIVVFVLSGLIYDMVRTHYLKEHLRLQLNRIAHEAALRYLPDDPAGARAYVLEEAAKEKLVLYQNSITLDDKNPNMLKIKTHGEAFGYMAYPILLAVGSKGKLGFGAEGGVQILVENRGPVWRIPGEKIFMAIRKQTEWNPGQFLLFSPVDSDERVRYWNGFAGKQPVTVGEAVALSQVDPAAVVPKANAAIEEGRRKKDGGIVYVAVVNSSSTVIGFAALEISDVSPEGVIAGEFVHLLLDGDFNKAEAEQGTKGQTIQEFGLLYKGQIKVNGL